MWLGEDHHARLSSIFAPHLGHPHSDDLDSEYLANIFETRNGYAVLPGRLMLMEFASSSSSTTGSGKSVVGNVTVAHERSTVVYLHLRDIGGKL